MALTTHSAAYGGTSDLLLEADADVRGAARHELLALVQDLLAAGETGAQPIRLRFTSPPANSEPQSGVFWSTPCPKS